MQIVIIYGTNSGGSKSVGEIIQQELRAAGHSVALFNAAVTQADDIRKSDLTIIGSCTWELIRGKERLEGQLQYHWLELSQRLAGNKFPRHRFAVYGLGDSGYQHFCAAADRLEKFVKAVGGRLETQTLRLDGYYFNPDSQNLVKRWVRNLAKALTSD